MNMYRNSCLIICCSSIFTIVFIYIFNAFFDDLMYTSRTQRSLKTYLIIIAVALFKLEAEMKNALRNWQRRKKRNGSRHPTMTFQFVCTRTPKRTLIIPENIRSPSNLRRKDDGFSLIISLKRESSLVRIQGPENRSGPSGRGVYITCVTRNCIGITLGGIKILSEEKGTHEQKSSERKGDGRENKFAAKTPSKTRRTNFSFVLSVYLVRLSCRLPLSCVQWLSRSINHASCGSSDPSRCIKT